MPVPNCSKIRMGFGWGVELLYQKKIHYSAQSTWNSTSFTILENHKPAIFYISLHPVLHRAIYLLHFFIQAITKPAIYHIFYIQDITKSTIYYILYEHVAVTLVVGTCSVHLLVSGDLISCTFWLVAQTSNNLRIIQL